MSEPLDFPRLESACWRALCRHCVAQVDMIVAATIIRLSFGIGEPFLRLDYAIELARLTGLHKSQVSEALRRLVVGRVLEVSADGCIYTFLPPSKAWPWIFKPRVDASSSDELERGIIWANKGGQRQGEFFDPPIEAEFAEALAIERMRAGLLDYHQAAVARYAGGNYFPVTDRLPTPAPAPQALSSGEGPARPLGTTGRGDTSSVDSLSSRPEEASEMPVPRPSSPPPEEFTNREPVHESRTASSRIVNPPLRALRDSKPSMAVNPLKAVKGEFTNRELAPPDPGATEDDLIAWMRIAFGQMCGPCFEAKRKCACATPQRVPVMDKLGGWWRMRIRESRWAALNTCMELTLRLTAAHLKPLSNRGGWARDKYFEIRKEETPAK